MDTRLSEEKKIELLSAIETVGKQLDVHDPDIAYLRKMYRYVNVVAETLAHVVGATRYVRSKTRSRLARGLADMILDDLLATCVHGTQKIHHCQRCEDVRTAP